jgi:restriction endonuclease S subunit
MNYYDLKRLPILVPSLKEQAQIIDYLDKETKYIDAMIVKLKMSIELLKEYKTSLISHAVSGKIKVS